MKSDSFWLTDGRVVNISNREKSIKLDDLGYLILTDQVNITEWF
jgi:hypothetical protein